MGGQCFSELSPRAQRVLRMRDDKRKRPLIYKSALQAHLWAQAFPCIQKEAGGGGGVSMAL